ncbi:PREDICTED: ATP-binding cassette sub-family C member 9-like [Priapulus caudatus]|uniref:ATP-binding cassette sub-family C member 9-like n=1 Tax=Priapulus caudatus TaxID=37621 RepID=A0ABM1FBZ9_PRICU|nr:PREDICTED: ATP-binding cassette sub-family C member 9-like [Priapulus caudatus]
MATEGSNEIKVRYRQSDVSIISKATMWWMNGILLEGYRQPLEMSNLGTMPHEHKAQLQFEKFSRIYADEKHKSADQPSLWWCYVRLTWRMMMMSGLYKLFGDLLAFVAPWVIDRVIRYVVLYDADVAPPGDLTNVTTTTQDVVTIEYFVNNGFVLSFLLFVSSLLHHTFTQSSFLYSAIEGMQLKAAVQSYIYNKALKLASWNDKGSGINVGEITNHLSTDASNLLMAASFFHFTWTIPLEIVFIACMLYYYLGYSALIGIAVVVVFLPVQYRIASLLAGIQKHTMECMDERMKRTNELLQGIRSIKLYAWEALMCDRVHAARRRELHYLLRGACVRALSTFVNNGVPIIVTLLSFGLYTLFEGELTATKAFSSLALFNMLNLPLFMFPAIVFIMVSARVSTGRLAAFFEAPEVDAKEGSAAVVGNGDSRDPRRHVANGYVPSSTAMKNGVGKCKMSNGDLELHVGEGEPPLSRKPAVVVAVETELTTLRKHGSVLEMCDASFAWDLHSKQLTLHSINLQLPAGKLTMVVGSVGCGKSSLLSAILGEIYTVSGSVDHRDATAAASIAYCAQTAWLLNASLRDNITFGQPYEHAR